MSPPLELFEDNLARSYRTLVSRRFGREATRASIVYGTPICSVAGIVAIINLPEELLIVFFIVMIPLFLILLFSSIHLIHWLFRNRWRVMGNSIQMKGEKRGTIQFENIAKWTTREISELPGYYSFMVKDRRWGEADIILKEEVFRRNLLDSILPIPETRTEQLSAH